MKSESILNLFAASLIAVLGWMATTLVEVDRKTAVIEERVDQNYRMLEPMWQEFTSEKRKVRYDDKPEIYSQTNKQATTKTKEPLRKAAWPPETSFTSVE